MTGHPGSSMDREDSMVPIRILHVISTLDVGGAEQNLYRLISAMDSSFFRNAVVSLTDIGFTGKLINERDIPVHALNMKKGLPDPRGILSLKGIINRYRPSIIQGWMYHANLFSLCFKKDRQILWNIRCSDMDLSRYGPIYRLTVRAGAFLSRFPQIILVNSKAGRTYHETLGYTPKRWEVIPNGFDTDLFKPDKDARQKVRSTLGIPRDATVIGLIARLDPMKDHQTFFKAAHLLHTTHPSVHFVLAGKEITPENPEIKQYIDPSRCSEKFHLLGQRHDIPHVLNALDIATSSSLTEGLPNTIGEAMATAIPCVVTDVGDSRILVDDTGYVVPKSNPEILRRAWLQLIDADPDQIRLMGDKARKRIIEHYRLDSTIREYEALYTEISETPVK